MSKPDFQERQGKCMLQVPRVLVCLGGYGVLCSRRKFWNLDSSEMQFLVLLHRYFLNKSVTLKFKMVAFLLFTGQHYLYLFLGHVVLAPSITLPSVPAQSIIATARWCSGGVLRYGWKIIQAPVTQTADNFIQWISCYPVDKMYLLEYILSAG